jgi:hypothetical protein
MMKPMGQRALFAVEILEVVAVEILEVVANGVLDVESEVVGI